MENRSVSIQGDYIYQDTYIYVLLQINQEQNIAFSPSFIEIQLTYHIVLCLKCTTQ